IRLLAATHRRSVTTLPRDVGAPPPPCIPAPVRPRPHPISHLSTRPVPDAPAPPPLHETSSTSGTRCPASPHRFPLHLTRASFSAEGSIHRAASSCNPAPRSHGSLRRQ